MSNKKEKLILKMSFFSGLLFAVLEFIFAIYSHSQSSLTDAVYDTAETLENLWTFAQLMLKCEKADHWSGGMRWITNL